MLSQAVHFYFFSDCADGNGDGLYDYNRLSNGKVNNWFRPAVESIIRFCPLKTDGWWSLMVMFFPVVS